MSENPLDLIRQRIREAEERLKKEVEEKAQEKPQEEAQESSQENAQNQTSPVEKQEIAKPAELLPPLSQDKKLQSLLKNLGIVLESSRDAMILVDKNGVWQPANRHLRAWLGYRKEELSRIKFADILQPEDAAKILDSLPLWLEGKTPLHQFPATLRGKGNERIPVLISSHACLDENSEAFAYLAFEDVRPQRKLESEKADAKALVGAVMREGAIPALVLNKDGIVLETNKAACEWLEIEAEEVSMTHLRDFVQPASREDFDRLFNSALKLEPSAEALCGFYCNSGAKFWARVFLTGITNAKGAVYRVLGVLDEIAAEPSSAWTAYGQMTPGVLHELFSFTGDLLQTVMEQIRTRAKPDIKRLVKGINGVRAVLSRWVESADLIPESSKQSTLADLVQQALNFRKAELSRWGIDARFENAASIGIDECPPVAFQALLHSLQWCIEQLREMQGNRRLLIRTHNSGDRMEVIFRCEYSGTPSDAIVTAFPAADPLRFANVELQAAQRLLKKMNGTLVLENAGKTHCSVRISLEISDLLLHRKIGEKSR
jgi:PAS domain S-box-containing protein